MKCNRYQCIYSNEARATAEIGRACLKTFRNILASFGCKRYVNLFLRSTAREILVVGQKAIATCWYASHAMLLPLILLWTVWCCLDAVIFFALLWFLPYFLRPFSIYLMGLVAIISFCSPCTGSWAWRMPCARQFPLMLAMNLKNFYSISYGLGGVQRRLRPFRGIQRLSRTFIVIVLFFGNRLNAIGLNSSKRQICDSIDTGHYWLLLYLLWMRLLHPENRNAAFSLSRAKGE